MGLIALTFRGLHPDTPELSDDLALLYRLVADEFEVAVDDQQPLYREVEFPVIELAQALDSWLRSGMADRRRFDFEPTGGGAEALCSFARPKRDGSSTPASVLPRLRRS